jgi:hypothetical protein
MALAALRYLRRVEELEKELTGKSHEIETVSASLKKTIKVHTLSLPSFLFFFCVRLYPVLLRFRVCKCNMRLTFCLLGSHDSLSGIAI